MGAKRENNENLLAVPWWATKLQLFNGFYLRRSGGVVILEDHLSTVHPGLPRGASFARDPKFPEHQVHGAVRVLGGPGDEPEWMILAPTPSFLTQTSLGDATHLAISPHFYRLRKNNH